MDRQHKALDQQRERKKADARRKFDVVKRKWTESDGLVCLSRNL